MEPEGKAWSNDEILLYVLTEILSKVYANVHSPEFYARLQKLVEAEKTVDVRRALIDIQTGPILELFYYIAGAIGPTNLPRIDLVNEETKASLSTDFLMDFAEAEFRVGNVFDPPPTQIDLVGVDRTKLKELWKRELCPAVTGIIFGNGRIFHLDLPSLSPTPFPAIEEIGRVVESTVASRSNVLEFIANHGEDFTVLDEMARERIHARNLALVAGATSMGSEGFVAVLTLDTQEIIWIAIFANSNPFVSVSYDASSDAVIAITSHEHVWKFPLTQPEKLQVSYLNW